MSLRGHIEDLGVAEILHVVGAARRSGLLRLSAGTASADVLFRDGAVVALRGAGMPDTLAEVLSVAGALDTETRAQAQAMATSRGITLDQALDRLGLASGPRAQQAIGGEIERRLPTLLALKSGAFEFRLVAQADPEASEFGALLLDSGLPVARLGASRGRSRIVPESAMESTGARRARLLMSEERIALPGSAPSATGVMAAAPLMFDTGPRKAQAPRTGITRTVLHCLQASPLRQRLLATLADSPAAALAVTSHSELDAGLEAARSRGETVAVACHAGHPDLPGVELLARLRSTDTSVAVVLLIPADWPVGRQSAVADRAQRLGARVVALVSDGGQHGDDGGADLAARLLALLVPPSDAHLAPFAGTDSTALDLGLEVDAAPTPARRSLAQLAVLSRWLAASGESAEIARDMLAVTGEHFHRGILLVRQGNVLEPLGMAGDAAPALAALTGLRADGGDFLSRAVSDGLPMDGPPPRGEADVNVLPHLGAQDARRLAVLPLVAAGSCFGVLVAVARDVAAPGSADDADESRQGDGGSGGAADLSRLSSFMMEAGPALWEALSRERRRVEARRTRAGA